MLESLPTDASSFNWVSSATSLPSSSPGGPERLSSSAASSWKNSGNNPGDDVCSRIGDTMSGIGDTEKSMNGGSKGETPVSKDGRTSGLIGLGLSDRGLSGRGLPERGLERMKGFKCGLIVLSGRGLAVRPPTIMGLTGRGLKGREVVLGTQSGTTSTSSGLRTGEGDSNTVSALSEPSDSAVGVGGVRVAMEEAGVELEEEDSEVNGGVDCTDAGELPSEANGGDGSANGTGSGPGSTGSTSPVVVVVGISVSATSGMGSMGGKYESLSRA